MTSAAQSLDHLALDLELPWQERKVQQDQFEKLIKKIVIPFMLFLIIMPMLPDLSGEEEVKEKVVAQVIFEKPKPISPPPQDLPKQKTQSFKPDAVPKTGVPNMASLSKQLAAMRNKVSASKMQNKDVFVASTGKAQQSTRSMLGKQSAIGSSGGLSAADLTVNAKGASLAEHTSGRVDSTIAEIALPDAAQYKYDARKNGKRDGQSVRRTIERFKGSVYSQYTKALRTNPDLAGRFVFKFVIKPDGSIKQLVLINSELGDKELERKLLNKIQQINFGKEDLSDTEVTYTYNFLPS